MHVKAKAMQNQASIGAAATSAKKTIVMFMNTRNRGVLSSCLALASDGSVLFSLTVMAFVLLRIDGCITSYSNLFAHLKELLLFLTGVRFQKAK